MANYTAADVKKLRDLTDAPMMECKAALEEAEGDFEKAQSILRQKGKAAAGKRADRATGAGVVAITGNADGTEVAAVVVECETDFVARNDDFVKLAQDLAETFLATDPGSDPNAVAFNGGTVGEAIEQAVGKIRENIKISKAMKLTTGNRFVYYVHHDNMKGAIVEIAGGNGDHEKARKVGIQVVALVPEVVSKDQLSQERLATVLEEQTQRAIAEGKPENIARNIAEGRVNKEWVKEAALLEQNFYAEPSKTIGQYAKEELGGATIVSFKYLKVGG